MTQDEATLNLLTRALDEAERENQRLHERVKALEEHNAALGGLVLDYHELFTIYKENDAVKYLKNHVRAAQQKAEELLGIKKS